MTWRKMSVRPKAGRWCVVWHGSTSKMNAAYAYHTGDQWKWILGAAEPDRLEEDKCVIGKSIEECRREWAAMRWTYAPAPPKPAKRKVRK